MLAEGEPDPLGQSTPWHSVPRFRRMMSQGRILCALTGSREGTLIPVTARRPSSSDFRNRYSTQLVRSRYGRPAQLLKELSEALQPCFLAVEHRHRRGPATPAGTRSERKQRGRVSSALTLPRPRLFAVHCGGFAQQEIRQSCSKM